MLQKRMLFGLKMCVLLLVAAVVLSSCAKVTPPPAEDEQETAVSKPAEPAKKEEPVAADPKKEEPAPVEKKEEPAPVEAKKEEPVPADPKKEEPAVDTAPAIPAGMVPLAIELPKPMFVGTPTNIEGISNLEKPRGKARPLMPVPPGVKLVSRDKPVSGSDEEPIMGDLEMITDGDKEAADGSYVELGPFVQHVTIDLEQEYDIYAVVVWHFHKQARVYLDVVVQISKDPDFIESATVYNNDMDNSAGLGVGKDMHYVETNEGRLIDAKGTRGRYVRLYSNGNSSNDLNHYIEVDVFGK